MHRHRSRLSRPPATLQVDGDLRTPLLPRSGLDSGDSVASHGARRSPSTWKTDLRRWHGLALLGGGLLLLSAWPAARGGPEPSAVPEFVNDAPRPVASVPQARVPPRVTAEPDDPAWREAVRLPPLTLCLGPDGSGLQPFPTTVALLWEPAALHVRFSCEGGGTDAPFGDRRDADHFKGDAVEVFLDLAGDGREVVELQVSPRNGVFDQFIRLDAEPDHEPSLKLRAGLIREHLRTTRRWDLPSLRTAVRATTDGWLVDIAIPASVLPVTAAARNPAARWGPGRLRAQFLRYAWLPPAGPADAPRRLVAMNWAPVLYGCPHISPAAMGHVELVTPSVP